jgi:indolepyruvate ferredoxin oxidoreductase alpha subunit
MSQETAREPGGQVAAPDRTLTATGSEALAWGALDAGVQFVTGYPGSPSTAIVEALLKLTGPEVQIEWAINEKSAADAALGLSLAGGRSLLCLKNVGLNVALDALMVANLAPGDGGFVILVGDDPGGWGSQNEEDSRPIAAAAEVPVIEPTSVAEARPAMAYAFELAERARVPVVVRVVRALTVDQAPLPPGPDTAHRPRPARLERRPGRWTVLPIQVVDLHRQLQAKGAAVRREFEDSPLNQESGDGSLGVLACGYAHEKYVSNLRDSGRPPLRLFRLGTLHPLPEQRLTAFLHGLQAVLVLEETAPYVETHLQAIAQRAGLTLPILGRASSHIPGVGELSTATIAPALAGLLPGYQWPRVEVVERDRISRQALCTGCPYIPAFDALLAVMARHGGRDAFVVTGETGCIVRGQLPPWELLDAKYAMGSSIGLAAGMARSGIQQHVVAVSGDSAFLHNGLGELIDAAQAGVAVLVVILDNGTTALSGGQPHPATAHDARGRPRRPVDLVALVHAAGAEQVRVVDPADGAAMEAALEMGLTSGRLAVVIARRECPVWACADFTERDTLPQTLSQAITGQV